MIGPSILIAVLGAGRASRFGGAKLAQPCAGKPLGRWAVDTALTSGFPVIAIAASRSPWLKGAGCEVHLNPNAHLGIGTSIALAARAADVRNMAALLILLADMPLIDEEVVAGLIAGQAPVACRYPQGHPGVPALFPRSAFEDLCELGSDFGAGALLKTFSELSLLDVPPEKLLDVDTPDDLARASSSLAIRSTESAPR